MLALQPIGVQIKQLKLFWLKIFPFATCVNDTGGALDLRISPQILEKIWNDTNGILKGLGETDSWKKPEVENFLALSL